MYGVVYVCVIDGYSGKIVSYVVMFVKNNFIIYEYIYRYVFFNWFVYIIVGYIL